METRTKASQLHTLASEVGRMETDLDLMATGMKHIREAFNVLNDVAANKDDCAQALIKIESVIMIAEQRQLIKGGE